MTDRIANPWGERTPFGQGEDWPVRVDQFLEDGVSEEDVDRWVQTASILHSNGDGLDIAVNNTLIGHLVAILAGALSLAIFGLLDHPSILAEGVTLARTGAAALSLALTGAVLLLLRSSHPPTGATTLIVSLGLLQTPLKMVMLMVGVVILTIAGWAINRALGVPVPVWSAKG